MNEEIGGRIVFHGVFTSKELLDRLDTVAADPIWKFCNQASDGNLSALKSYSPQLLTNLINRGGKEALSSAAHNGKLDVVCFLLEHGVSANSIISNEFRDRSILQEEINGHDIGKDNLPVIKVLLQNGAILSKEAKQTIQCLPHLVSLKKYFAERNQ